MHKTICMLNKIFMSTSSSYLFFISRTECKSILHTSIELMNIKQMLQIITNFLYYPQEVKYIVYKSLALWNVAGVPVTYKLPLQVSVRISNKRVPSFFMVFISFCRKAVVNALRSALELACTDSFCCVPISLKYSSLCN
jgi:hypothetical protein